MLTKREVIMLHIGQCGIGMGNAIWELLSAEHNIDPDGRISFENQIHEDKSSPYCLFDQTEDSQNVPRSIMVDLEPTVVDEVRSGIYKNMYHPDSLISHSEDSSNNFARGLFTIGQLATETIIERLRKMYECCDKLQAIMFFRALSGGTGTGLTSALFESLPDYGKIPFFEIPLLPSPTLSSTILEPYNAILAQHFCLEDIDMSFLIDNEAVYDILSKYMDCPNPTFSNVNRIIAQPLSALTASMRFNSSLYNDIVYLQTNLVPYPRIHYPMMNMAPVLGKAKATHQKLDIQQITSSAFDRDNQLVKCDKTHCKYMCCALLYRGAAYPREVYDTLMNIKSKKSLRFVDWCPTGFKVGIVEEPPTIINSSLLSPSACGLTMLSNTSSIGTAIQRMTHKFHMMYSKRAYVHWYVSEGLEEYEFTEAIYNLGTLVKDYEEVSKDSEEIELLTSQKDPDTSGNRSIRTKKISETEVQEVNIDVKLAREGSAPKEVITTAEMTRFTSPTETENVDTQYSTK